MRSRSRHCANGHGMSSSPFILAALGRLVDEFGQAQSKWLGTDDLTSIGDAAAGRASRHIPGCGQWPGSRPDRPGNRATRL